MSDRTTLDDTSSVVTQAAGPEADSDSAKQASAASVLELLGPIGAIYVGLVLYASLYPWSGWRDPGLPAFAFLSYAWSPYFTWFDVLINVAAYVPLGFLATMVLRPFMRPVLAAVLAWLVCSGLSLALETLQVFLPSRVPSKFDLASNAFGALLGAALVLASHGGDARLRRLQSLLVYWFGHHMESARPLLLIALWLLSQLSPVAILFGNGDLRPWLAQFMSIPYSPDQHVQLETTSVAANVYVVGSVLRHALRHGRGIGLPMLLLLGMAFCLKSLALVLLLGLDDMLQWLTPGAILGVVLGLSLLTLTRHWSRWATIASAVLALATALLLVNLGPLNPYAESSLAVLRPGQLLNLTALTRFVADIWPLLALWYLLGGTRARSEITA